MDIGLATSLEPSIIVSLLSPYIIFLTYLPPKVSSDLISPWATDLQCDRKHLGHRKSQDEFTAYRIPWELANTAVCVTTTIGNSTMEHINLWDISLIGVK